MMYQLPIDMITRMISVPRETKSPPLPQGLEAVRVVDHFLLRGGVLAGAGGGAGVGGRGPGRTAAGRAWRLRRPARALRAGA